MRYQSIFIIILHYAFFNEAKLQITPTMPTHTETHTHLGRLTRSLIFPPTSPTRVQFIGGIGIPVEDLHFESVTSGYVLKAEYFLPETAESLTHVYLKPQIINGRQFTVDNIGNNNNNNKTSVNYQKPSQRKVKHKHFKSQHKNAATYRWIVYRGIEMVLQRAGLPGRTCMLRSICEHATLPLDQQTGGLLAEILHILLTPSTSLDDFAMQTDQHYLIAEQFGKNGGNCLMEYIKCNRSPIDLISKVFEFH